MYMCLLWKLIPYNAHSNRKPQSNDWVHGVNGLNNYIDLPMDNRYRKTLINRIPSRHRLSVTPIER